jgi:hypothetical protein
MMAWHDEYPHSIFASVGLINNKITGWKTGDRIIDINSSHYRGGKIEWTEFIVNNQDEHNEAFNLAHEWFKQWEIADNFRGNKPY